MEKTETKEIKRKTKTNKPKNRQDRKTSKEQKNKSNNNYSNNNKTNRAEKRKARSHINEVTQTDLYPSIMLRLRILLNKFNELHSFNSSPRLFHNVTPVKVRDLCLLTVLALFLA